MSKLTEAYKVMQEHCGIEVGDTVKVLREWKRGEMGFEGVMYQPSTRPKFVGEECVVSEMRATNVVVEGMLGEFCVSIPFFCLELVEKAKPKLPKGVTFEENGLTVGGTFVSLDTIKRNYDL